MRILFLGDIVGNDGRRIVRALVPELRKRHQVDVVIANGENAAGGAGITPKCAEELYEAGIDLLTTGNHIWNRKEIFPYLDQEKHRILRPANYPAQNPGVGILQHVVSNEKKLTLINLASRVFMAELAECPFRMAEQLLSSQTDPGVVLIDLHGEATSEKGAFAHFLDGRVSAVVGTHTHVQTADERILPGGTAFITDVGMCGAIDGVIGVEKGPVIERFLTGINVRFGTATGRSMLNGVLLEFSAETMKATKIERIRIEE